VIDVTERRQTEEALPNSEQRLRSGMDNWPSILYIKDPEGDYLLADRAGVGYSNEPPERMKGKTEYDFLPREYADHFRADGVRIFYTGKVERCEEVAPI
jgi:PAS domain-containing protein